MTLANTRAKASANAKHFYNTGVNYDYHLRSSKYFYSTGHRAFARTRSFCKGLITSEGQKLEFFLMNYK